MKSLARPFALLAAFASLASVSASALASDDLQNQVTAILAEAGPGIRWGLVATDEQGRELIAIDPDGRYMPASNTKLFTTAAALWKLTGLDQPDIAGRAGLFLAQRRGGSPDVVIVGHGGSRLSSAPDCVTDCLAGLAERIAARTRKVGNVIGDDRAFRDQRWSQGMSWNNFPTPSGTAMSALTLDDNEAMLEVTPGKPGKPATVTAPGYFRVINAARTVSEGKAELDATRHPGSRTLEVSGTVLAGAPAQKLSVGIDDPAERAAWAFSEALRAKGVRVTGKIVVRHQPLALPPEILLSPAPPEPGENLNTTTPAPLGDDIAIINKQSQNLHAELLLRRLDDAPVKSTEGGLKVVYAMLQTAGLTPAQFHFADGSGMSTYNRIAPRGMIRFLSWTTSQPWGEHFRATLPVGGVDGTLAKRFKGTSLEGRITAKTGTINASNTLSGFLVTRSGRTLTFAAFANDVPEGQKATPTMDKALVLIAEAN